MKLSAQTAGGHGRRRNKKWRAGWSIGLVALCGSLAGNETFSLHAGLSQPAYLPDNVFAYPAKLPLNLQRVAVLPLAVSADTGDLVAGSTTLTPVVWEQLIATKKFETIAVKADFLRSCTGRLAWAGTEALPPDFFDSLRREYACDAVLFTELTTYRAYAPLAVGWRFKLVDVHTGQIIWATDEIFDAAQPAVAKAARRFAGEKPFWVFLGLGDRVQLDSPRQFGRYSAAALLATLPER